jgi:conserved oligomeric Golgi complex subunit 3
LASVLNATTSLLPNALFASLGLPRADASILDTRQVSYPCSSQNKKKNGLAHYTYSILSEQSIDADLKRACEDVISCLSDPLIGPLTNTSPTPSTSPQPPPPPTNAGTNGAASRSPLTIDAAFRQACERDLHAQAAQVSLYLTGGGAGGAGKILLQHVRERVEEAYLHFVELSGSVEGSEAFLRREEVRRMLEVACATAGAEEGVDVVANETTGGANGEGRAVAGSSAAAVASP